MAESGFERDEREKEFVLIKVGSFTAFVTRYQFQMATNYFYAMDNAETWGDFKAICGPNFCEYSSVFLENDTYKPSDGDLLSDIKEDVWILDDADFPIEQFLQETTMNHGENFPTELRARTVQAESGCDIDLYPSGETASLLRKLREEGIVVESVNLTFA